MMHRNRKKNSGSYLVLVPFAVMLVALSALSLCYLWLCGRCEALGEDIRGLEVRKAALERNLLNEDSKWANTKSPLTIEKALKRHGLIMMWPAPEQIVRLPDSGGPLTLMSERIVETTRDKAWKKVVMND